MSLLLFLFDYMKNNKIIVNIIKKTLIVIKNNVIFKLFFIYHFNNLI